MNKHLIPGMVILLLASLHSFASDTTYRKHPWYMSVGIGYAANRAFGSMEDHFQAETALFPGYHMQQKDWASFAAGVGLQKQFGQGIYFKTGLSYIQKQVNPEEYGPMVYKDSLKTGYLSIPALVGIELPLNRAGTIFFAPEGGFSGDIRFIDHSKVGIDRVGMTTSFATLAARGGAGLVFATRAGGRIFVQFTYIVDLTAAYKETLDEGTPGNRYQTWAFKYRTQLISLGWQWRL